MMSQFATLGLEFMDEFLPRQFQNSMQYFDDHKIDRRNWGLGNPYVDFIVEVELTSPRTDP